MPSTKCEGLSYPIHFLKSRGSIIRNNFLKYRTKQAIAPDKDWKQLGVYPPLFGLLGLFKF